MRARGAKWLLTILLFLVLPAIADHPSFDFSSLVNYPNSLNTSLEYRTPLPYKFQNWLSFKAPLSFTSKYVCNITLLAYKGSVPARKILGPVSSYCNAHLDCMLSSVSETIKADMASASVLLGLMPTILASIGPTVAELSLLSLRRPFLTFLISLGSPGINPGRVTTYEDPFALSDPYTGALIVPRIRRPWSVIIAMVQYLLAATAAFNVWQLSYILGVHSVISWWCTFSFAPLIWASLTLGIYSLSGSALRIRRSSRSLPEQKAVQDTGQTIITRLSSVVGTELTLSANDREPREPPDGAVLGYLPMALHLAAGWVAIAHVVFGTAIFSGLIFINIHFGFIVFLRFITSSTICRLLISFELGGTRSVPEGRCKGWIKQADTMASVNDRQVDSHLISEYQQIQSN